MAIADERGSLTMALLAIVVIGSLVGVLTATVIGGQRHTRFDQSYEQALQIAEIGLDRMTALVEARAVTGAASIGWTDAVGGRWRATAEVDVPAGSGAWRVRSWGRTSDGVERSIEARISAPGLFVMAAFGRQFADFNGGNGADSYRSGSFTTSGFSPLPTAGLVCAGGDICPGRQTHRGTIATNGRLKLKGQTFTATDAAEIHFARERIPDPRDGATGYCDGVPLTCDGFGVQPPSGSAGVPAGTPPDSPLRKLRYMRDEITLPPVVLPHAPSGAFDGNGTLEAGRTYVFTTATFTDRTTVQGTPDDPTIVYLAGTLKVANHTDVNFGTDGAPRPAPGLLIFSAAAGTAFDFGNHVRLAAALYGPDGSFAGGAQGHVYGSLVANAIDNNGGWTFHYDEALGDVKTGSLPVRRDWVERSP